MTGTEPKLIMTGDADLDGLLEQCFKVFKVKGDDYTIGNADRLHNFRTNAEFVGLDMMQVWSVFFYKHLAAIFSYVKTAGKSQSEPIEERILDAINYLLLFYKMVKERQAV